MKKRTGWVSNSSTSSFICDVCGAVEAGRDASLSDFEMSSCDNGHTFHNDETNLIYTKAMLMRYVQKDRFYEEDEKAKVIAKLEAVEDNSDVLEELMYEEDIFEDLRYGYELPSELCPICNLSELSDRDMKKYLLFKYSEDKDKLLAEIKEKYETYENFEKILK